MLRKIKSLLPTLLLLATSFGVALAQDRETVESILAVQKSALQGLRSFDVHYTRDLTQGDELHIVHDGHFRFEAGKFRSALSLTNSKTGTQNQWHEYAFNGELYQQLRAQGTLAISKRNVVGKSYLAAPAIQDPYRFAYFEPLSEEGEDSTSYKYLQRDEVWKNLAMSAVYLGEQTIDGENVAILEFRVPGDTIETHDRIRRVYFNKQYGLFPQQYEDYFADTMYLFCRFKAENIQSLTAKDGTVYFVNARSVMQDWDPIGHGRLIATTVCTTDIDSMSVNADINDDDFTIPVSEASIYYDRDSGKPGTGIIVGQLPHDLEEQINQNNVKALGKSVSEDIEAPPVAKTEEAAQPVGILVEQVSHRRNTRLFGGAVAVIIGVGLFIGWFRSRSRRGK